MARWFAIGAVTALIAGCGASAPRRHGSARPPRGQATTKTLTIPAPAPTGIPASPAAIAVIRKWANALRRGDVAAAAAYFKVPSVMINGVGANGAVSVIKIHNRAQALLANETLPCGARLLSTDMRGQYVNALFVLTGRPGPGGSSCTPGVGQTARTNFVIAGGRIIAWIRAPSDPGDSNGQSPGPIA